jgi:glycine cleavage system H lipoate-binding protein
MKGRIAFKSCLFSYACNSCDFDQYFLDQLTVYAPVRQVAAAEVEGIRVPHGFYFHPGHTWLKVEEGSRVRVGIDDFARRLSGPLDSVSAPLIGKKVETGASAIRISRSGRSARLRVPAGGIVTAVNLRLSERGGAVNEDPYGEGWVLQLHASNLPGDLKDLMIGGEAREFMAGEIDCLYRELESATGPLAADGGSPSEDICGHLPEESWVRFTRIFFRV